MNLSAVYTLSNTKVSKLFFYGLACAYVILLLLYLMISEYKYSIVVVALIGLYFARHFKYVLNNAKLQPIIAVLPLIEVILLFQLFMKSGTEIESIVFIIFVADLLLHYKSWYALPFAYIGFVVYLFLWPAEGKDVWQNMLYILSYTCVVLPIWSTKLLLNQRDLNIRLNEALLQEASTKQELAVFKERSRIAEEVHDTVGHSLTTAIIALEGAQLLITIRPEEARNKIKIAREQLKYGLGNIRQVVRTLKTEDGSMEGVALEERIVIMMTRTEQQTGVQFKLQYDVPNALISLQDYVIINAIKEAVTNALKHGHASKIAITVVEKDDMIHVTVQDNGKGSRFVTYGFGLQSMKERIEAVGGQLNVISGSNIGFSLHIKMPSAREG